MLKKLLIVFAALAVIAIFLLARDWDSPELGRTLLGKVSSATGIQIEAEGFRLNLLQGVVLEKVNAKSSTDGRELTFQLDRLVFEHRLLPLLTGTVAIDRIHLAKPRFEVVRTGTKGSASGKAESPDDEAAETTPSDASGGLALEIRSRSRLRMEALSSRTRRAKRGRRSKASTSSSGTFHSIPGRRLLPPSRAKALSQSAR